MTTPTRQPAPPPAAGLTVAQMATLLALVQAQAALRKQLRDTAVAAAVAAFAAIPNWWDTPKVVKAIEQALRLVQPTQRQAARVTDAYLARVASVMTGRTVRPAGAVDVTRLRRSMPDQLIRDLATGRRRPAWLDLGDSVDGPNADINADVTFALADTDRGHDRRATFTDPREVYGRVADQARRQIVAESATQERASRKALVRVAAIAETDITLAVREQWRKSGGLIPGITGFRRILHPELSETGPCALCVVAADRVYKKQDLIPIHDRCVCEVLPVIGAMDPGINLNADDLAALYGAAGGTGAIGLHRVRVALTEHGELGPVLVNADQRFRGPADVARATSPDRATRARAQLASLEAQFVILQHRAARGEDVTRPLEWHTQAITRYERELANV